jgi:hypothetical protein
LYVYQGVLPLYEDLSLGYRFAKLVEALLHLGHGVFFRAFLADVSHPWPYADAWIQIFHIVVEIFSLEHL